MLKTLTLLPVFSTSQNRSLKGNEWQQQAWGRKAVIILLIALNAGLLFAYILGVNSNASIGYEIKDQQNKNSLLVQENKKLNLQISEQTSANNVQKQLVNSGYVITKQPIYIKTPGAFSMR